MIEQLQMVLTTIGDLGEYAVWVVMGFFIWKLATLASILLCIKFGIQKFHDMVVKNIDRPQMNVTEIKINDHVINHDGTPEYFMALIAEMKTSDLSYVHKSHIDFAITAIKEKRARTSVIKTNINND